MTDNADMAWYYPIDLSAMELCLRTRGLKGYGSECPKWVRERLAYLSEGDLARKAHILDSIHLVPIAVFGIHVRVTVNKSSLMVNKINKQVHLQ